MHRMQAVDTARQIMTEGQEWSVVRWLFEKRRVRLAADEATAALAEAREQANSAWSEDLVKAYAEAAAEAGASDGAKARRAYEKAREAARNIEPAVRETAQRIREADAAAYSATMEAEEMFAAAERSMSGAIARDAARRALESYDLREKAIRKAEAGGRGRSRGIGKS